MSRSSGAALAFTSSVGLPPLLRNRLPEIEAGGVWAVVPARASTVTLPVGARTLLLASVETMLLPPGPVLTVKEPKLSTGTPPDRTRAAVRYSVAPGAGTSDTLLTVIRF